MDSFLSSYCVSGSEENDIEVYIVVEARNSQPRTPFCHILRVWYNKNARKMIPNPRVKPGKKIFTRKSDDYYSLSSLASTILPSFFAFFSFFSFFFRFRSAFSSAVSPS